MAGRQDALVGQVEHEGRTTVLVLRGEADFSTTLVLSDILARGISSGDGTVVIDLSRLGFIDTGAARVLAAGERRLHGLGRKLVFRSPNSAARRVLGMFGLTALIEPPEPAQAMGY